MEEIFLIKKFQKEEAKDFFKDNKYKLELINEIISKKEDITLYTINFKNGEIFTDLCRGGHSENIQEIDVDSFEISHLAGSYWRGDEKRETLTRIYGLAFENKKDLEDYKNMIEEAKKEIIEF